jgi:Kae1-associated kinase Bud32
MLYKTDYLGAPALLKERVPKKYRNAALDEGIRRQRTKQEAVLLHRAKEAGVRTPALLKIDRKNASIWMEWVDGKQLKEELNAGKKTGNRLKWGLNEKNMAGRFEKRLKKLGEMIAQLHAAGIIHGDLTTSNALVNEKEMALIDFGLGFFSGKTEDRAVDLLNFKKTFQATHASFPKGLEIVLDSYRNNNSGAAAVFRQMEKVEGRIRYA